MIQSLRCLMIEKPKRDNCIEIVADTFVLLLARFHLVCLVKKKLLWSSGNLGIAVLCVAGFYHDNRYSHAICMKLTMSLMRSSLSVFMFDFAEMFLFILSMQRKHSEQKMPKKSSKNISKRMRC